MAVMYKDYCYGEYRKEMFALSNALREKIIVDLKASSGSYEIALPRLAKRLTDNYGITTELAIWTNDSRAIRSEYYVVAMLLQ